VIKSDKNLLRDGLNIKKESSMSCQKKSTTKYDSPLLVLLSANRATRKTAMITNSNHAYLVKELDC
jgi:hypothetical protein